MIRAPYTISAACAAKLKAIREQEEYKKKHQSTKIMTFEEVKIAESRYTMSLLCQATNMNGKQCKSRAVCGKYCNRHKI
jgi:hypothetical protein